MKRTMVYFLAVSMLCALLLTGCGETGDRRNDTTGRQDENGVLPGTQDTLLPEDMQPDPEDGMVEDDDGIITDDDTGADGRNHTNDPAETHDGGMNGTGGNGMGNTGTGNTGTGNTGTGRIGTGTGTVRP